MKHNYATGLMLTPTLSVAAASTGRASPGHTSRAAPYSAPYQVSAPLPDLMNALAAVLILLPAAFLAKSLPARTVYATGHTVNRTYPGKMD